MCKKLIYLVSFVLLLSMADNSSAELVARWRFDETSGTNAYDASGNGNDGRLVNMNPGSDWVTGKVGGALDFDGSNDYVEAPDSASLDITGQITLAAWIKPESADKNWVVFGKYYVYWLWHQDDNCRFYAGGTNLDYGFNFTQGVWYHVAGTFDGSTMRFYINGEEKTSQSNSEPISTSDDTLIIGNYQEATGWEFTGAIDDVHIYNSALTQEEIQVMMRGEGYPFAFGPTPADGELYADTWASLSWSAGETAVSHDVYFGDNFDDVNSGAEGTFIGNQAATFTVVGFPGFAYPDGLIPGTTYYWRVDEVNEAEPNSPWKGEVWSFSIPPKTAYFPDPADAAEQIGPDAALSWTLGYGAKLHTVYFGESFNDVNSATGGLPQGNTTYTPGTLKLAKTYYWRVDEFDAIETYKGNVWSFTTVGAVGNPNPANGAVDVKQTQIITWSPSVYAASHQFYFGTDKDAVKNADTGSPEYIGTRDLGAESYDPGMLLWDTTYYWRVDEVNDASPDSPWPGILWSFTTANFLVVDDFESYNDLDPADPESNRIFNAWIDGYEDPENGSLVGYDTPPFAEQTIVHGGNQSMPMSYDNSVGKSEATLTLTSNRDWTVKGVDTLTIWFRGDSGNTAEKLYVALNGNARVDNDNPDAATLTRWTPWNIDLQAFADQGVNLANVNSITLGLSSVTGGTGMMYFDDIRLYPPAP